MSVRAGLRPRERSGLTDSDGADRAEVVGDELANQATHPCKTAWEGPGAILQGEGIDLGDVGVD